MKCLYCGSSGLTMLNKTCYCEECTMYFRIKGEELDPIFFENTKVYREYIKLDTKPFLCGICQDREEKEHEKTRAEEEHRMELVGQHAQTAGSVHSKKSTLCRLCIEKVNSKLKADEEKYLPAYKQFVRRRRIEHTCMCVLVLALHTSVSSFLGWAVLVGWDAWVCTPEQSLLRAAGLACLGWCIPPVLYLYAAVLMGKAFTRYRVKKCVYIEEDPVNVEHLEEEVLHKLNNVEIETDRKKKASAQRALLSKSFVHRVYVTSLKKNEEVADLCSRIESFCLRRKDGGKIDKLFGWMQRKT
ncbi:hypothetical protein NECID01_1602 [Nematocida sp. AWRm77]|nr:hypothetical protein NECID01_1602 [Nematocida sp. AWRm77]